MALENTAKNDDSANPGGDAADSIKLENLAAMLDEKPEAANTPEGDKDGAAAGTATKKLNLKCLMNWRTAWALN